MSSFYEWARTTSVYARYIYSFSYAKINSHLVWIVQLQSWTKAHIGLCIKFWDDVYSYKLFSSDNFEVEQKKNTT